jgi:rhomboid protease GluP
MGLFAAMMVTSFRFPPGVLRARLRANAIYVLLPSLLPLASVLQSSRNLTKVDYGAHFGGALAGTAVGLLMLSIWPSSESQPRLQKFAAAIAIAGLLALIIPAVPLARNYENVAFMTYLIPQEKLPKNNTEIAARADELIAGYPRDPRPHLFKASALLDKKDVAGAEREARAGLAEEHRWRTLLSPSVSDGLHLMLAIALNQDRRQEALAEARRPCLGFKDGPMRKLLDERKLCEP